MKKKLAGLLLGTFVVAAVLTGCGSSESPAKYVQNVLDTAYNKGSEDAGAKSGQSLEAEAKILAAYFGIQEPSDEVLSAFKDFSIKMYEKASYTVTEKGDKVQVAVKPLKLFDSEEIQEYIDDFNIKQFVDGDESCTDEAFAKGIIKLLEKKLDKPEYGKETTIEVSVSQKDGKPAVSDEDLEKVDEQIIAFE